MLLLIGSSSVFAQRVTALAKKPPPATPIRNTEFTEGLNRINAFAAENRYTLVIHELTALTNRAKELQYKAIQNTLPSPPTSYIAQATHRDDDSPHTLFSQLYFGPQDQQFEIFVLMSDPSIEDYAQLIQNPSAIAIMEDTKIIEIKPGFKALERVSQAEGIYERHVILNHTLLLGIIGIGISNRSEIDQFCNGINFTQLQTSLQH